MRLQRATALAAVLVAAGLAGCDRGATANPNAPGSPGTGNGVVKATPQAPDGPPGGPSGIKGSLPHTGGSGADMPAGATGGHVGNGPGSQQAQPGTGLTGGLGAQAGMSPASATRNTVPGIAGGSKNTTTGGSVGNR